MPEELVQTVRQLAPRTFENLIFDLLQASGMMNLTWRTPGPDGGRDIEGIALSQDASGYGMQQRWYIECKRYSTTIDWPTVWGKIAYADNQKADFLLLATNSNPSPQCETEIERWNANRRSLKVRVWRGYDLDRLFTLYPHVAAKYGLRDHTTNLSSAFLELASELMKIVQTAHVAHGLGRDAQPALEAGAAVSELFTHRLDDLKQYGHAIASTLPAGELGYDWVDSASELPQIEEVSLRALLSVFRFITGASQICIESSISGATFRAVAARFSLGATGKRTLEAIALWTTLDLTLPVPFDGAIHVSPKATSI
jgi:hypothetical protein